MDFVDRVSATGRLDEEWRTFIVAAKRTAELDADHRRGGLKPAETKAFIEQAFRDGAVPVDGHGDHQDLPPASRFSADGGHGEKKQRVLARLGAFFERFFGAGPDGDLAEGKGDGDKDAFS